MAAEEFLRRRGHVPSAPSKGRAAHPENKVSPYYAMVDLLFEQQKAGEALGYVEAAKARVLLDVLQSGRVNITKATSPREQGQERSCMKGDNRNVAPEITDDVSVTGLPKRVPLDHE